MLTLPVEGAGDSQRPRKPESHTLSSHTAVLDAASYVSPGHRRGRRVPAQSRSEKPTSFSEQNLKMHRGTFKRTGSVGPVNHPHVKAKIDLMRKQNSGINVIIQRQSVTWVLLWTTEPVYGTQNMGQVRSDWADMEPAQQ